MRLGEGQPCSFRVTSRYHAVHTRMTFALAADESMIELKHDITYFGPNILSPNPVVVASIAMASDVVSQLTMEIMARTDERLVSLFPEWRSITESSVPAPATWLADRAARWALAALVEVRGYLHD